MADQDFTTVVYLLEMSARHEGGLFELMPQGVFSNLELAQSACVVFGFAGPWVMDANPKQRLPVWRGAAAEYQLGGLFYGGFLISAFSLNRHPLASIASV